MNENIIGLIAGGLTSISMIPQLMKVIREKNVEDISLLMLLVLISGLSFWVGYGFMKGELPIIFSNSFAVIVNISLLVCYIKYRKKK
nr:SemiSWEET transporter [uncultured Chryseobacterium sp.]